MPIPAPPAGGTTLNDLVNEIRSLLRSHTALVEPSSYLTAPVSSGDLSLPIASSAGRAGLVEIDDELVLVDSVASGALVVPPFGRGFEGSTAAAHDAGTRVVFGPLYPRQTVIRTLAEVARAVYPKLFAVRTAEFTYATARTYDLLSDAERVLRVTASTPGVSGDWVPIRNFALDKNANTDAYPSGRSLTLGQVPCAGETVRVVYAAPFDEMTLSTDTLVGSGFAESHRDVLVYGAVARLVQFLDPARLQYAGAENAERAQFTQAGLASQVSRQIAATFAQRLEEERKRLLGQYPTQLTWSR